MAQLVTFTRGKRLHFSGVDPEFRGRKSQNCFKNSFPLCGILMAEFSCYCRFRYFLKLNFLVVEMFNACVLYLRKKIIRQLIKKGGRTGPMRPRLNPPLLFELNVVLH